MKPWITLSRHELIERRLDEATGGVHFPERLAEQVIAEFSARDQVVLDPFAGYGTTAAVAVRMGRQAIAIEILPDRAERIRRRSGSSAKVIVGNARELSRLVDGPIDLCFTSLNRTDSGGGSIVWRNMESWQRSATTASGGIHLS